MKKLIAGVILLGILSSCGNKKTNIDPFASITKEVDSVRQIADSSHHDKSPEDPQPIQADESCLPNSIIIHCCLIEKKTWI